MVTDALLRWSAPAGPWTEPDLHLFPQDGHRYEIVDGGLHVTPPLSPEHERTVSRLVSALRAAGPDGWWACTRLGLRIGDSHLIPDVAVLRPGSCGSTWNKPSDIALVVEVESPATRHFDRLVKAAVYAEAGIPAYWRVEPDAVQICTLGGGGYGPPHTVRKGEPLSVTEPFPLRLTW